MSINQEASSSCIVAPSKMAPCMLRRINVNLRLLATAACGEESLRQSGQGPSFHSDSACIRGAMRPWRQPALQRSQTHESHAVINSLQPSTATYTSVRLGSSFLRLGAQCIIRFFESPFKSKRPMLGRGAEGFSRARCR